MSDVIEDQFDDKDVEAEVPEASNDEEEDSAARNLTSSSDPVEAWSVERVFSFLDKNLSREIAERFLGKRNWSF